ncbi:MAG TPA: adenylate/guanylate cyclase domain-containing protein [Anaerolineales bacterium]|nr:adenylate/guanylate cyclase domain-containing protein [Anaerolineales bacterium]
MDHYPSGTVTFLFTDIEGSTKLAQQHPTAMPLLLARHNEILKQAIESHNGFVFQIVGDSFSAAFHRAVDALQAALDAQRLLQQEAWSPAPIKVRMGIHTGQAAFQPNGEYDGYLTLSHSQRLMSAAHGGQVLISFAAQELVRHELPQDVTLRDMGERRLKDVIRSERIYQLLVADLPRDFPPLKTLDVYHHNIPAPMTSFIGRQTEMAEIKQALSAHRLVTLTGSGGAGKSRLSLQIGMECLPEFSDGVWLVELAPVTDPSLIPQTLLSIFKLREDRHRNALDVLIDHVRDKTVLLILDNCEHLIDACAQLSQSLLEACPKSRILASSREPLGITGEVAYRVPSLTAPNLANLPSLDQLEKMDSVRLFVERAAAAKPGFALTQDHASAIAQICSRLDGIPLAIELAASRIKVLSPDQIAARLDDRFRLLTGGSRTALPRQQTLRAAIDWSYSLLSEQEQRLFRRLAVFVGGWTLEAAEAVCGEKDNGGDVLDLLTRLVDKSLIIMEETRDDVRYRRLETIRQYSREKFLETDEVEAVRDRHLDFFVHFAELVDEKLKTGEQVTWQRRMAAEQDNLRAALDWGLNTHPDSALRIAGAANLFWTAGGYSAEGFRWTQKALEQVKKTPLHQGVMNERRWIARARALRGLTRLYLSLGDNASAKRAAQESVALYRQSQDRRGLAFALVVLAYPLEFLGEREQVEAALQESYSIARDEGDTYVICRSLNKLANVILDLYHDSSLAQGYVTESLSLARESGLRSQEAQASEILGFIAMHDNNHEAARAYLKEAMRLYQEMGASFNVILEKSNLGHLERKLGNHAQALEYYCETILAFRDIGQTGAVSHQLECFGFIALAQQENERALRLFAAANALREKSGTPMTPDEQAYFDGQLHRLRENMDLTVFNSIWSQGHGMKMEQAIEFAVKQTLQAAHA